ncbi:MAG TPA: RNA polymerase sigma factor [Candidatus Baltobacteraceae bacterium]|nr:RNA polymerase sigma factor [Candidatus Baltobacteraceae bacterium]
MRSIPPHDLIEGAQRGGPVEIERLIEAIWPDAYRLAYAILGERTGAEDVAQEACVVAYRTISSLRSAAAFRVWFYRIVVRRASELKRRRARGEPIVAEPASDADCSDTIDIWRALAALPRTLRDVVVLHYFEGLTSREIASILCAPEGTVRFRLMIAKRRLRPLLAEDPDTLRSDREVQPNGI